MLQRAQVSLRTMQKFLDGVWLNARAVKTTARHSGLGGSLRLIRESVESKIKFFCPLCVTMVVKRYLTEPPTNLKIDVSETKFKIQATFSLSDQSEILVKNAEDKTVFHLQGHDKTIKLMMNKLVSDDGGEKKLLCTVRKLPEGELMVCSWNGNQMSLFKKKLKNTVKLSKQKVVSFECCFVCFSRAFFT